MLSRNRGAKSPQTGVDHEDTQVETAVEEGKIAPVQAWTWMCDGCGKPARDGIIEITDPRTGGYPRWSEADEKRAQKEHEAALEAVYAKHREPGSVLVAVPFGDFPEPRTPRCNINVYHRKCDPQPNKSSYWLRVEEHYDLKEMLDTVAHLLDKVWFGVEEAQTLIRRFQDSRVCPSEKTPSLAG